MSHLHFVFICCVASQLPQEKTGGVELIVPVVHSSNAAGAADELIVVINSFNQVCCLLQATKMLILTCLDCCKASIRHGEPIQSSHTDELSDQIKLQSRSTCSLVMVCEVVKS